MPADPRPAAGAYNLAGGTSDDRAAAWAGIKANPKGYLDLLKVYDEVALVAIPGATDKAVQGAAIEHCEAMLRPTSVSTTAPLANRATLSKPTS